MKRLIVSVSAFALAASLFAGDTKTAANTKDTGSCCDKAKAGSACCSEGASTKSACSKTPSKRIAMSPKAVSLAAK
jgi:hypothetical protein